jgi:hypothetical protein
MKNHRSMFHLVLTMLLSSSLFPTNLKAHDYLVQSLESIIKRSSAVIEGRVLEIRSGVDRHNIPVETVTIAVDDVIAGNLSQNVISLRLARFPDEDKNRPILPHFVLNEGVILHLKEIGGQWIPLGHDQGKFVIKAGRIGNSQTTLAEFKSQIKDFITRKVGSIVAPRGAREKDFEAGDHDPGAGIQKLNGQFHLLDPTRYGPTSGVITLRINPANARDKDGNALTFQQVKAAVQRAVDSWNSVTHSYVTLAVSDQEYTGTRSGGNGISTVTFEGVPQLGGSNGAADVRPSAGGIINEVDLWFHSDNRWNTDITYPSSYPTYNHPVNGTIGPVDLEDVAAHEVGHGVGLHHVGNNYTLYTMHTTNYQGTNWWEKTWRRSLEDGDKAGKAYQDPSFPGDFTTQQLNKMMLAAPSTVTLPANFIIPAGKMFEVDNGRTIKISGGGKLIINGGLNAPGNSSQRITFTSATTGNWQGIELSGSGANNSSLQYCDINNATQAVNIIGSSNILISNCTITGSPSSSYGIRFSQGSTGTVEYSAIRNVGNGSGIILAGGFGPIIAHNSISNNAYHGILLIFGGGGFIRNNFIGGAVGNSSSGIYAVGSGAYLEENSISGFENGVYAADGASLSSSVSGGTGRNWIQANTYGLRAANQSSLVFGVYYPDNPAASWGYCNKIAWNSTAEASATNYSTITARANWWGDDPPPTNKFIADGSSSIDYSCHLLNEVNCTWTSCASGCPDCPQRISFDGRKLLNEGHRAKRQPK